MRIALPVFASDVTASINTAYLKYIHGAGFEAVPFSQFNNIETVAKECDGLLLPGGIDVEPTYYGDNNVGSHSCKPEKDDFERHALRAFLAEKKGVFGICRGFQLMVREFILEYEDFCNGVDFYQHVNGHSLANDRNAKRTTPTHAVHMDIDTLYGEKGAKNARVFVNSIHHQALVGQFKRLNVKVNAKNYMQSLATTTFGAPTAGKLDLRVIEAVDIMVDGMLLRGVQWHPEELMDTALITTYFKETEHELKQLGGHQAG